MSTLCPCCNQELLQVGIQMYPARFTALNPSLKPRVLVHCDNPECPMYEATCTEKEIFSNWQRFGSPSLMPCGGAYTSNVTTTLRDCVFCDSEQVHLLSNVTIEGRVTRRVQCLKCDAISCED